MTRILNSLGKELKVVLATNITVLGIFISALMDINFAYLGNIITLSFLLFVPGYLFLGAINAKIKSLTTCILFSIGMSCSIVMLVGFFMNIMYPIFGIAEPISKISTIVTMYSCAIVLFLACMITNPRMRLLSQGDSTRNIVVEAILSASIITITCIGTLIIYYYGNNKMLFLALLLISLAPMLIYIKKISFPIIILGVSLSLLMHNELSSLNIQGSDLHIEYYFASLVKSTGYWDFNISHNYNAALSDSILPCIISNFSSIELVWVYKLVYPLLFSMTPIALYKAMARQFGKINSFLATYLFVSIFVYYTEMLQLSKQMIAEFFLSLIILIVVDKKINSLSKKMLSIIFILSIVVSHYGTSYIMLISLLLAIIFREIFGVFFEDREMSVTKPILVGLFLVSTLSWYMYMTQSSAFITLVNIGEYMAKNIGNMFFDSSQFSSVHYLARELALSQSIMRYLYYVTVLLTVIGLIDIILSKIKKNNHNLTHVNIEYLYISLALLLWLVISIVLPFITGRGSIGFTRIYHISFICLAPFCILGGIKAESFIKNLFKAVFKPKMGLCIFLTLFFLFNTSVVSELIQEMVGGDKALSPSLSQTRIEKTGTIEEKIPYYGFNYPDSDKYSAQWLGLHKGNKGVLVDSSNGAHTLISYGKIINDIEWVNPKRDLREIGKSDIYVYLRKINYVDNIVQIDYWVQRGIDYPRNWILTEDILDKLSDHKNEIYFNGSSVIYGG